MALSSSCWRLSFHHRVGLILFASLMWSIWFRVRLDPLAGGTTNQPIKPATTTTTATTAISSTSTLPTALTHDTSALVSQGIYDSSLAPEPSKRTSEEAQTTMETPRLPPPDWLVAAHHLLLPQAQQQLVDFFTTPAHQSFKVLVDDTCAEGPYSLPGGKNIVFCDRKDGDGVERRARVCILPLVHAPSLSNDTLAKSCTCHNSPKRQTEALETTPKP